MFQKSISHGVLVACCGLGIVALQAVVQAIANYHPQGYVEGIVVNASVPVLTAACAGLIHFLNSQETTKEG